MGLFEQKSLKIGIVDFPGKRFHRWVKTFSEKFFAIYFLGLCTSSVGLEGLLVFMRERTPSATARIRPLASTFGHERFSKYPAERPTSVLLEEASPGATVQLPGLAAQNGTIQRTLHLSAS